MKRSARLLALALAALFLTASAAGEAPAALTVRCGAAESETVGSTLRWGLFLEDINHALDGGLYAELVKNRSFEYGNLAQNGNRHGWSAQEGVTFEIIDGSADGTCLHANNPHYARVTNAGGEPAGILGCGFLDGMAVEAGKTYVFSVFMRADTDPGEVTVSLRDTRGTVYAEAALTSSVQGTWRQFTAALQPSASVARNLRVCLSMRPGASLDCDMVSLMPEDTFAGLPVRRDLGELLAAMHPAFLRFPGGCAAEGRSAESIYNWKDSVGSPEGRPQGLDIWQGTAAHPYYTTYGLGFYEFFCLCEALGCEPLPVLNAGMTCPIQSPRYIVYPTNSYEFRQCVQDALDLAEFCRGGTDTKWGALRAVMGHPEPFPLTMIAIGNEQWQSEYFDHYLRFVEAFDKAEKEHPEIYGGIRLVVANGPAAASVEGWDYVEGYVGYEDTRTAFVDEHYYMSPDWFLEHTDRYDSYDRSLPAKVFLGEYASQGNRLINALAEAAFMTGLERNGDAVSLACYAPLFGNATQNQWVPDMIFFNNISAYVTPDYHVQSMFMNSPLTRVLPAELSGGTQGADVTLSGGAGLGSWMTSVAYDNLTVTDNRTGETLFAADFDQGGAPADYGMSVYTGRWSVEDGRLVQRHTGAPDDENTGDALYFGDKAWTDYTLSVEAEILGGAEGFLIPVCVGSPDNTVFWNVGGWGNTVSCLQTVTDGAKSGQVDGTVSDCRLKKQKVYRLEVKVSGDTVVCSLDGRRVISWRKTEASTLFASAGLAENGDLIVRAVNVSADERALTLRLNGFDPARWSAEAAACVLSGESSALANSFLAPEAVAPPSESAVTVGGETALTLPPWSLTVIRIPALNP